MFDLLERLIMAAILGIGCIICIVILVGILGTFSDKELEVVLYIIGIPMCIVMAGFIAKHFG